jgi:tetratricopeptide (TPR) repeat protein
MVTSIRDEERRSVFSAVSPAESKTSLVLGRLLGQSSITPAELARRTHLSPAAVSNIRHGRRHGDRGWIESADVVLGAGGELTRAWDADEAGRRLRRVIASSAATAEELCTLPDAGSVSSISELVASLGIRYLHLRSPGGPLLDTAQELQAELARRLRQRACRTADLRELQLAAGRVSGIIAYATLDLGDPATAGKNAAAAFRMGELAAVPELQAWARGTQSLIARFRKDYRDAETLIYDGLHYASGRAGTAGVRLLSGGAQCRANLGDRDGALDLLDQADAMRGQLTAPDEISGLFAFSEAKGRYYGGSSLMWLADRQALRRAVRDSGEAIVMWAEGPDATRSVADQALAHVYQATAYARLGHLDDAMESARPVLGLPPDRRISWLRRRVNELAIHLQGGRYAGSALAARAVDELTEWADAA